MSDLGESGSGERGTGNDASSSTRTWQVLPESALEAKSGTDRMAWGDRKSDDRKTGDEISPRAHTWPAPRNLPVPVPRSPFPLLPHNP